MDGAGRRLSAFCRWRSTAAGAEDAAPASATVVIGGITVVTLLTLLVLPGRLYHGLAPATRNKRNRLVPGDKTVEGLFIHHVRTAPVIEALADAGYHNLAA
ncbi:MAG: hypothetical protein IPJ33_22555 [Gammaproteobacteria bacterium]|nr:hypothetical protein [Gammaproteobacteria bacterium]